MNKYPFLIFIVALCTLEISCSDKSTLPFSLPVFQDSIELKGKVLTDNYIMGACFDIAYYNHTLSVIGYTGETEPQLHLFSTKSGEHIKSLYPKGRGPGEAISVPHIEVHPQTGMSYFYDYTACRLHYFQMDSIIRHSNTTDHLYSSSAPYMAQVLKSQENYVGIEGVRKKDGKIPRIFLFNRDTIIDEYFHYPPVELHIKNGIKSSYVYANYSISPQGNKMVCTSIYGAIMEIFNITSKRIELDTVIGFIKPVYDTDKNGFLKILPQETIWGFIDSYATKDYIYTIYCGENNIQNKNKIAVFDWNGQGVCLYTTDYNLECICVNDHTQTLYATAVDAEGEKIIVEFKLPKNNRR